MPEHYYEYRGETVYLKTDKYANDGSLAVTMFTSTNEPYATVTVNVGAGSEDEQTIDTNNLPDILDWLVDNGIAMNLYENVSSGFCTYPIVFFNLDMLN